MSEHPDWEGYRSLLLDWYRSGVVDLDLGYNYYYWDAILTSGYLNWNKTNDESARIRSILADILSEIGSGVDSDITLSDDNVDQIIYGVRTQVLWVLEDLILETNDDLDGILTAIDGRVEDLDTNVDEVLTILDTTIRRETDINRVKLDKIEDLITNIVDFDLADIYDSVIEIGDTLTTGLENSVSDLTTVMQDKLEDFVALIGQGQADIALELRDIELEILDAFEANRVNTIVTVFSAQNAITTMLDKESENIRRTIGDDLSVLGTDLNTKLDTIETRIKDKIDDVMKLDNVANIMTEILLVRNDGGR